ncbi:MAG TPA: hypothetical protein VFE47_12750 [Tepidisphaeraceae bacterium]|jgi:hypothetical protein|nr:hypothetical protein [Tepidisphaeraceae bacterium]
MRNGAWVICAAVVGFSAGALRAQSAAAPFSLEPAVPLQEPVFAAAPGAAADTFVSPLFMAQVEEPPSVYPEIMPAGDEIGTNTGGVNFGLDVDWLTDYVYRGVDQSTPGRRPENALQFDVNAEFDLGKLPHPFIGLFVNVFNSDPISRFEEVRPYLGLDWNLRPFKVVGGFNSYIHPNRKNLDTQEVFASVTFDDSLVFRSATPIFSPYVYGAYDISLYNGFYLEAGLKHDFVFEDWGLTLSPRGDIAYIFNDPYFEGTVARARDSGLQHFDVGLVGLYSLNHLLKINRRYGEFSVKGSLYYTARIDKEVNANTLIWGGVGLEFRY